MIPIELKINSIRMTITIVLDAREKQYIPVTKSPSFINTLQGLTTKLEFM